MSDVNEEYRRRRDVVRKLARSFSVDELELLLASIDPPPAPEVISLDARSTIDRAEQLLFDIASNENLLLGPEQRYTLGWLTGSLTRHDVRAILEGRAQAVQMKDAVQRQRLMELVRLRRDGSKESVSFIEPDPTAELIRTWWKR